MFLSLVIRDHPFPTFCFIIPAKCPRINQNQTGDMIINYNLKLHVTLKEDKFETLNWIKKRMMVSITDLHSNLKRFSKHLIFI
jgi:hypothetical protein